MGDYSLDFTLNIFAKLNSNFNSDSNEIWSHYLIVMNASWANARVNLHSQVHFGSMACKIFVWGKIDTFLFFIYPPPPPPPTVVWAF